MDGDAIPDTIEENGWDFNGEHVDLAGMGAKKDHKDIFLYVDWLEDSSLIPTIRHSHEPSDDAINKIKEAFANAPVENLDGDPGINLIVMKGKAIEENDVNLEIGQIIVDNGKAHYHWGEFADIKDQNFPLELWPIFHYAIFGHDLPPDPTRNNSRSNGIARSSEDVHLGGSDFFVALGRWEDGAIGEGVPFIIVNQRAITGMHELGHNLGLHHGGVIVEEDGQGNWVVTGTDATNYKPNHLSIMNYSFMTRGLIKKRLPLFFKDGILDYSKYDPSVLPDLVESGLSEPEGLNAEDEVKDYATIYHCRQGINQGLFSKEIKGLKQAVDWNCDRDKDDRSLSTDINKDGDPSNLTTLTTVNEWDHLRFNGGAVGAFSGAVGSIATFSSFSLPETTSLDGLREISFEEDLELGPFAPAYLDISKIVDKGTVRPEETVVFTIEVTNVTEDRDAIEVVVTDNLPSGFVYQPGSTTGATTDDPAINGQTLTFSGPFTVLKQGAKITLSFEAIAPSNNGTFFNNSEVKGSNTRLVETGNTAPVTVRDPDSDNGRSPKIYLPLIVSNQEPPATGQLELASQIGGPIITVAVRGSLAYISEGGRLVILDISDRTRPLVVGKTDYLPGIIEDMIVIGDHAYVANGRGGLRIIDITNPANPFEVGSFETPGYPEGIAVTGNYAYIADRWEGLRIIDITNPANPFEVGSFETQDLAKDVGIAGNYAYIAGNSQGLRIIDVKNPSTPIEVSIIGTHQARGVAVVGDHAYVADCGGGLRIVDITSPTSPFEVGTLPDNISACFENVKVRGNYAYIAADWMGLRIVNITDPAAPVEVGFFDTPNQALDVDVASGYVYVADRAGGLRIINVTVPQVPTEVGFYDTIGFAQDIAISGHHAYIASYGGSMGFFGTGLQIVDIANPAKPVKVGSYEPRYVSRPWIDAAYSVAVKGNYAYMGGETGTLRIVNISNSASPFEVGTYDPPLSYRAEDIVVAGNYAYIADQHFGLRIIDVSNPAIPTEVGIYDIWDSSEGAYGVAVKGNYAYIADNKDGLHIIDITNPAIPTEVGIYDIWDSSEGAYGVAVKGNYAYIAGNSAGLRIVDITNPWSPIEIGSYNGVRTLDIAVAGNYAYTSAGWDGSIQVIDVSNSTNPFKVSSHAVPSTANSMVVSGRYIYAACWNNGLLIFQMR